MLSEEQLAELEADYKAMQFKEGFEFMKFGVRLSNAFPGLLTSLRELREALTSYGLQQLLDSVVYDGTVHWTHSMLSDIHKVRALSRALRDQRKEVTHEL